MGGTQQAVVAAAQGSHKASTPRRLNHHLLPATAHATSARTQQAAPSGRYVTTRQRWCCKSAQPAHSLSVLVFARRRGLTGESEGGAHEQHTVADGEGSAETRPGSEWKARTTAIATTNNSAPFFCHESLRRVAYDFVMRVSGELRTIAACRATHAIVSFPGDLRGFQG